MDPLETVAFARALVDIDSTTGREADAGRWLAARLAGLGYTVMEQPLARGCANVLATLDPPEVVFSTHFDCVPPFIPSRLDGGRLYGRGSCDAKGILAAQVAAAERLRQSGERRVGLLFVAGEERGSDGAAAANTIPNRCRFLINGEPTESQLALATRGAFRVRLHASGRAAHSSMPEEGESAIEKLVDALVELRSLPLPASEDLGTTSYSVGLIEGGVAPNVVPAHAAAEIMFRTVGPDAAVLDVLRRLEPRVTAEPVLHVPPIRMHTVAGFEPRVFPFTTDVPLLGAWGKPLLFGPGSIRVAHTDDEYIALDELHAAVDAYVALARGCLAA
jgi:acetylornithine deacetylase